MANCKRNRVLQDAFAGARGHRLHLLGLVSDGGVHSHYRTCWRWRTRRMQRESMKFLFMRSPMGGTRRRPAAPDL